MSGGALRQHSLRLINRETFSPNALRDLVRALERIPAPVLRLVYQLGAEAGIPHDAIMSRGSAIHLLLSTGNLTDDLVDGDCNWIALPSRAGPCVQYALHALSVSALANTDATAAELGLWSARLADASSHGHDEVHTDAWTLARYQPFVTGVSAGQWRVYLAVLWAHSAWSDRADALGLALGIAGHVAEDIRSGDPRWQSLTDHERVEGRAWALEHAMQLHTAGLPCLTALSEQSLLPVLQSP